MGASDRLRSIWQDCGAFAGEPALVLWGLEDIAFRSKERWTSALRDVEVRELEDCGHFVAKEASGRVVAAVRGLIGRLQRFRSAQDTPRLTVRTGFNYTPPSALAQDGTRNG